METIVIAVVLIAVIIAVSYLFIIMPRCVEGADMELISVDYAHRGLWGGNVPENSLPAFALAVNAGCGMEFDVQLSRDGKIMVFHDYSLKRMCGVDKKLSDLTFDELRKLRLAGTQEVIPTLAEVLRLVDGRVPLLIEFKGENRNTALCRKASAMLDNYCGAFCVESFNPLLLAYFKSYRPRYARGQLFTNVVKSKRKGNFFLNFALSNLLLNFYSRPDFIAADFKTRKNLSFFLCTRLFRVKGFLWTVRTQEEYNICRAEGRFAIFERIRP